MRTAHCSIVLLAAHLPFLGCGPSTTPVQSITQPPTFHRDIAPILFARCATCHHPDGAAPFNLLTYNDAHDRASQIAEVTQSRFMPPWLPEDGHEPLSGSRRLSDAEVKTLADWAADDAPEGDPNDSPPEPTSHSNWQLGQPDLVIESPLFVRCLVLEK